MNYFFTSDHHFDHAKILDYSKRPFPSVQEMNESLIDRWNEIVKNGDVVYHLGDFGFTRRLGIDPYQNIKDILKKLNGQVNLICGNHDCFSIGHQLLTKDGWINIENYVNSRMIKEIATFNAKNGEIEFQLPTDYIRKYYKGYLINFNGPNLDLTVTPTHNMLYYFSSKKYYKTQAVNLPLKARLPLNGIIPKVKNDYFYNLLGFSFADATFILRNDSKKNKIDKFYNCRIQFHFKKKRKIEYLSAILNNLNYKFNICPQKDGTYFIRVYGQLAKKICEFFCGKKEIPIHILQKNCNQMFNFVLGYLNGDGSKKINNCYSFCSISEKSVDLLFTISRLVGINSHRNSKIRCGNYKNSKPQYHSNLNVNNKINLSEISERKDIFYDNYVYCVSVPNENILIRFNNKICISGNCQNYNQRILSLFASTADIRDKTINGQRIIMCHFPMIVWSGKHHGSIMLCGHSHYNLPVTRKESIQIGKILDVGVDGNNFYPYSFEEIKKIMESKPMFPNNELLNDHHKDLED